jgi:HPt (histidine-containing phosphotransfer) domain-containing protein
MLDVIEPTPATKAADARQTISLEAFWTVFEDDLELAQEVVGIFCESTPQVVDGLRWAVVEQNQQEVVSLLHRLKGSVGYIGFKSLANFVQEKERKAQNQGLSGVTEDIDTIELKLVELINVLKVQVLGISPPSYQQIGQ